MHSKSKGLREGSGDTAWVPPGSGKHCNEGVEGVFKPHTVERENKMWRL
jgi:hypothetical protein